MSTESTTQTDELDISAATAEISAELFGQGGSSETSESQSGAEPGKEPADLLPAVEAAPAQQPSGDAKPEEGSPQVDGENSQAVQDIGGPKTWSKEALESWAAIPPRAQQEILKREEDVLKGIAMYKDRAEVGDRYEQVVQPYRPILEAENIDPVQMFHAFAANHYILTRGTEQQKLDLAANMISGYGIDLDKLNTHIGGMAAPEPIHPEIVALRQEVEALRKAQDVQTQQTTAEIQQQLASEIETFAKDPANPFFSELVDDISKLFETGQAKNLRQAYDLAVFLNPVTREKEVNRLAAEKAASLASGDEARKARHAKTSSADLSLDPKPQNGTVQLGSIDDTLAETMARINARA